MWISRKEFNDLRERLKSLSFEFFKYKWEKEHPQRFKKGDRVIYSEYNCGREIARIEGLEIISVKEVKFQQEGFIFSAKRIYYAIGGDKIFELPEYHLI